VLNTVSELFKVIGLMSGTSLDGIDAALLETDGESVARPGPALTLPYRTETRAMLHGALAAARAMARGAAVPPNIIAAERVLTDAHVDAVALLLARAALKPSDVDYLGFAGQTLLHRPAPAERWTWQIGDGAALARATGIAVVDDFRTADVAAGGQGAPFVPLYHRVLAQARDRPLVVVNIGGVANVTYVGADDTVIAFDTGPGNAALDDWAFAHTGERADVDGKLARAGRVDEARLAAMLNHPMFAVPPPKSFDRFDFPMTAPTAFPGPTARRR
jgi:anhydro-N-acetylmuramic acid kinase